MENNNKTMEIGSKDRGHLERFGEKLMKILDVNSQQKFVFFSVEKRDKATLSPIIRNEIENGYTIIRIKIMQSKNCIRRNAKRTSKR